MTIYLCVSLIIVGLVLLSGARKAALIVGLVAVVGGFGYRLYAGEEFRAVMTDAIFVIALLPIGWWAAKEFAGIVDAPPTN